MLKSKKEIKRMVLLDAHAILHRAYHALPDFTSTSGEPTGALYGLSLMLLKIIEELRPDYIVACFDLPKPTYRHQAFKDYKAGRKEADSELVDQIKKSRDLFNVFNIPIYDKEGFEADDILGTIVEKNKNKKDLEIFIASGDMDTLQLVDGERVRVYTLKKGIKDTVIYDEIAARERFGFGPELLPDFKGLRGDPSDNIPGIKGVGEKTATILITKFGSIESIYKKIKKDEQVFKDAGLTERLVKLVKNNEEEALFSKELALIRRDAPIDFNLPDKNWREGLNIEDVAEMFRDLAFKSLIERLKKDFEYKEEEKNIESVSKSELRKMYIALWLLDSENTNPDEGDVLRYSGKNSFKEAKENILKKIKENGLYEVYNDIEVPLSEIVDLMKDRGIAVDVDYLKKLSKDYHKELNLLEKRIWDDAGEEFNINSPKQLGEIIYTKLGLGGSKIKKTSTGAKSTKESELLKLKGSHQIIDDILQYRELQKLLSTYIDNIPLMIDEDGRLRADFNQTGTTTGRMSSQNPNLQNIPIKTDLGRKIRNAFVSSEGYKLLAFDYSQIELRIAAALSKDKKLIEIFKKGEDVHTSVASVMFDVPLDKVDSEMRRRAKVINFGILYGMGVNALMANLNTDRKTAQDFYNEYFEKFSGLSDYLESVKKNVYKNGYTETYYRRRRYFPGIKSRLPYIRAQAERMAINAPIQGTQADIIKKAMVEINNFLKKEGFRDKSFLLLQVHDELIYEVKESVVKEVAEHIKNIMENIIPPKDISGIKLKVDLQAGYNWGEMEKVKLD